MNGSSLWLEDKYVNLASSHLQRFTRRGPHSYSFRCNYCGDSQKNRFKTRGSIFESKGRLVMHCFNCGIGRSFDGFMKDIAPDLYREFRLEVLRENGRAPVRRQPTVETAPPAERVNRLQGLTRADHFEVGHPVNSYLRDRLIPDSAIGDLYYTNRFMEWVNTQVPGKFDENQLRRDEPRLVIPFVDSDGVVFAVTGRSFKKNSIKYMTIKFDDRDKVFGMDRVDPTRRVYVVEGPIDSFFIDNSIAFAGSSGTIPKFDDAVIVLDNEPRNREIVRLMERFISKGDTVCIWPSTFTWKDINEARMAGLSSEEIKRTIDENTYDGLKARVRLNSYRKI